LEGRPPCRPGGGGVLEEEATAAPRSEDCCQEGGGVAGFGLGDFFGGADCDDFSAAGPGFGADVQDVVGFGDDVEVVLDHYNGSALVCRPIELLSELCDASSTFLFPVSLFRVSV
jgi:hypothetical protein